MVSGVGEVGVLGDLQRVWRGPEGFLGGLEGWLRALKGLEEGLGGGIWGS